jgi:hypothetical protein
MIAPNMANETNVPTCKTLPRSWVKLLDDVRLPVPQASHDRVCKAIRDNRSSLRDIAELMQDSPALVLSVMREANSHTHGSLAEPAENLEVALNRLGLKRAEELLARLPSVPMSEIPVALRQLQLISQHAPQQANGLFASRLARLWQDIHWGSLLFLSPLWPLALAYPKLLDEWELRVIHKGESARTVEQQLFGVRLLDLCQAWPKPGTCRSGCPGLQAAAERAARTGEGAAYRPRHDPLRQQQSPRRRSDLRRWLNQPANTVLLANGLAMSAQESWTAAHPALAVPDRAVPATAAGRGAAAGSPASRQQRPRHRDAGSLAPGAVVDLAVACAKDPPGLLPAPAHRRRALAYGASAAPSCWWSRAASPTPCT